VQASDRFVVTPELISIAHYMFGPNDPPSFKRCILTGSLGFCASSLLVFGTVAFGERWMYANLGVSFSYATWTLLFVLSGALVFNSLVSGALRGTRFCLLFAAAFMAYAAGWCVAYFLLGGAPGEWCGSLLGALLMAAVFAAGFRTMRLVWLLTAMLLVANSLGYFIGSALNSYVGGKVGMIMWGMSYGLFLGAGIGTALHFLQKFKR
jgi:hypothetical protein